MYDPLKLSSNIESLIVKSGNFKRYYRFRAAKYYGGISTADVVGCNMHCCFCWVHPKINHRVRNVGNFYSPELVGQKLAQIAQKGGFKSLRISGGEPTIGQNHLISVLKYLEEYPYEFILETNGILLAHEDYVKNFSSFNNLYVRISLKAGTPEKFSKLTGAIPEAYYYPLKALQNLIDFEIPCHASIIRDFCEQSELGFLKQQLQEISLNLVQQLEYESLMLYPHVKKGLARIGYEL